MSGAYYLSNLDKENSQNFPV